MGDKTGVKKYKTVDAANKNRWAETFNTRYRMYFAKKYLDTLGDDVLYGIGYSRQQLLEALADHPPKCGLGVKDAMDDMRSEIYRGLSSDNATKMLRKVLVPGLLTWRVRHNQGAADS